MNGKALNIVLVIVVLLAAVGGGAYLYMSKQKQDAMRIEAERDAVQAVVDAERAKRAEIFETFLNGFLQTVAKEAQEYKNNRRVLAGLIQPENLRAPEYAQENYSLGETTVMSLRLQMDKIMKIFDEADDQFRTIISDWPKEQTQDIRAKWNEVKNIHTGLYIDYFESEGNLLAAMQNLLAFYNQHRDQMVFNPLDETISFDDPQLADTEDALRLDVEVLTELQEEMLEKKSVRAQEDVSNPSSAEEQEAPETAPQQ